MGGVFGSGVYALPGTWWRPQVGDSSALLGGMIAGDDGDKEVAFEELMDEHGATNAKEYERIYNSSRRGKLLDFVYDVPDLIDEGKAPAIFKKARSPWHPRTLAHRIPAPMHSPAPTHTQHAAHPARGRTRSASSPSSA